MSEAADRAESIVVVGAGAAGFAVVQGARTVDRETPIIMLSDEPEMPWDRPPLSKAVLTETSVGARYELISDQRLSKLDVDLRLGASAAALDTANRTVRLSDGTQLGYSDVVIATGGSPRMPSIPGFETTTPGVHVLRTQRDAQALRRELIRGARLVIFGAGFLGLEVAATATSLGCQVTIIEAAARPLEARLGETVSGRLLELHQQRGVRVMVSTSPIGLCTEPDQGRVTGVVLDSGDLLAADVVLVAIGCVPNTGWLAGSGLDLSNGVVCDEFCRAAPHVWAAGDVAAWRDIDLGTHVRVEHRSNAGEQGRAVGLNIVAARTGAGLTPYLSTPFFWTDQFGVKMQAAGHPHLADRERVTTSAEGDGFVVVRYSGPHVIGVLAWNAPKEFLASRRELAETVERSRSTPDQPTKRTTL